MGVSGFKALTLSAKWLNLNKRFLCTCTFGVQQTRRQVGAHPLMAHIVVGAASHEMKCSRKTMMVTVLQHDAFFGERIPVQLSRTMARLSVETSDKDLCQYCPGQASKDKNKP